MPTGSSRSRRPFPGILCSVWYQNTYSYSIEPWNIRGKQRPREIINTLCWPFRNSLPSSRPPVLAQVCGVPGLPCKINTSSLHSSTDQNRFRQGCPGEATTSQMQGTTRLELNYPPLHETCYECIVCVHMCMHICMHICLNMACRSTKSPPSNCQQINSAAVAQAHRDLFWLLTGFNTGFAG